MLVLSRKLGERICIGGDIYVNVLAIHGGKVRLGIEAPRSVPIHRQELLDSDALDLRTSDAVWVSTPGAGSAAVI
jgi:carbon storage regulator